MNNDFVEVLEHALAKSKLPYIRDYSLKSDTTIFTYKFIIPALPTVFFHCDNKNITKAVIDKTEEEMGVPVKVVIFKPIDNQQPKISVREKLIVCNYHPSINVFTQLCYKLTDILTLNQQTSQKTWFELLLKNPLMKEIPQSIPLQPLSSFKITSTLDLKLFLLLSRINDPKNIIIYEKDKIIEELNAKHYSSAILYCGRCAEAIAYAISRSWGINTTTDIHKQIARLESSLQQLKQDLLVLTYANEQEKPLLKKDFINGPYAQHSEYLHDLLQNLENPPSNTGETIRRKSIFTLFKELSKELGGLSKEKYTELSSKYREITEYRNHAAHTSDKGIIEEYTHQDALRVIKHLEMYIQILIELIFIKTTKR